MKEALLQKFEDSLAADNAALILSAAGIEYRLETRAAEYTSIVLGGPLKNRVDIYVSDADLAKATQALKDGTPDVPSASESDQIDVANTQEQHHFRRAVILSFLGIFILPIVFNCLATLSLWKLFQSKESLPKKVFALAVVILGWLSAGFVLKSIVAVLIAS